MSAARNSPDDVSSPDSSRLAGRPVLPSTPQTPKSSKSKRHTHFWRATRFIYPYRRIVSISVTCAFFVGLAMSGGLTTMMPIMKVLLSNQSGVRWTVTQWVNSQVVEKRLGISLVDSPSEVRVLKVHEFSDGDTRSPAAAAGLRPGDNLMRPGQSARETLASLADPHRSNILLQRDQAPPANVVLPPLKVHWEALRRIASHISPEPVWAIGQVLAVLIGVAVLGNILKFFQEYLSDKAATLAVNDIRRRLYDHVLHIPMSHFARRGTSDITSRLVQDASALEQGFKTVLGQSIQEPIKAAMAFGLALVFSWKLTLMIVVFGPVMGIIISKFGKKMRRASRSALQKSSLMLGQIEATLSGIRVVKGASAERFERRRYRSIMGRLIDEQLKMARIDAFSSPTLETLTMIVVCMILLIATWMVTVRQSLDVTRFFVVMACLGTIADSLRRLNKVNNVLQRSNSAAERIFEIMDLPVERVRENKNTEDRRRADNDGALSSSNRPRIKLPSLSREVRFENLTFAYPGASQPAIQEVDLGVPKGQCVAVVGRNGSGKTTLLALLPRFYDAQQGRVTIDGIDVRDATLRSLRQQISIVTQDSVIFPGTIAQNIAYGNSLIPREQIIDAAKRAFAHDFILEKPRGYDTLLGEMGGQLSGGQKQRLCIARAILRNAPILILDEATSQVDAESEHLIQQAIESLMHESADGTGSRPTTFVIAHRFSTILNADTIVVMDRGRIVGQGRHDELLRDCETYQQLYERQLVAAPVG